VLKEHFNFYSSHFFDRALVLLLKSGFLVLYTSLRFKYNTQVKWATFISFWSFLVALLSS